MVNDVPVLLFLVPPVLEMINEEIVTVLKNTSHLTCIAEAYPNPQFRWYKGTSLLNSAERLQINSPEEVEPLKTESVLSIDQVDKTDFGNYRCVVNNSVGSAEKNVTLLVQCKSDILIP